MNYKLPQQETSPIEMEHAIGYSGRIPRSVQLHGNGQEYICISGASLIVTDINDPHKQWFLQGHDDQITCLAVSNNGQLIASGQKGDNADVILWAYSTRKALFRLSEHDYEIVCVEFSHDDRLLFSCGNAMDKRIFIWDTNNGYIVGSVVQKPEPVIAAKWGGFAKDIKGRDTTKYQFATTGNKQVCIWKLDVKVGTFEGEMVNTGNMIRDYLCMDFSKNREDYLILGTASGDFCAFQMKNKFFSHYVTVAALGVQSIRFIDNTRFLVGAGNGTLAQYTFNQENKVYQHTFMYYKIVPVNKTELGGGINSISIHPSCKESFCSTDKGLIYRVNNETLQKALHSENHTGQILNLGYPQGISDRFASASEDGSIRLWDISDYIVTARCTATNAGSPLCLEYRDEVLLSGWQDGRIRMFKSDNGQLIWQIENAHNGGVFTLCISMNLKFFCSGGNEGDVRVWEMRTREMVSHLKEHTHRVTKVQLIGNETQLITASRDRALLQWDLKTEKRVSAHIQRMGGLNYFDIVPNTSIVISTGQDRKITYWDLNQVNCIRQLDTNHDPKKADECFALCLSHDGNLIATGGSNCSLKVWDAKQGVQIAEGLGHSGPINTVQFSADDKQLITGGKDGVIILWNIFI